MVCKHFKDEKKNFDDETNPLTSEDWIAEKKENGFRCLAVFSPETGFEFYSRRVSVKTYLNTDFTDKILLIKDGLVREPKDFINAFNYRFAIDCEVLVNADDMYYDGIEYSNVEDYLQSILGALPERSKTHQRAGGTLYFKVFDVLYFEKDPKEAQHLSFQYVKEDVNEEEAEWVEKHFGNYLATSGFVKARKKAKKLYAYLYSLKNSLEHDTRKFPFYKRRKLRDGIVKFLQEQHLPFEYIETEDKYKVAFADDMIREGCEGVILKSLHAPYISDLYSSRSHRASLKVKTSVAQLLSNDNLHADFDCTITGFSLPKSKRLNDMVGSLKCSVYLEEEDGTSELHEIANISGIPHEIKRDMAIIDSEGNMSLNPEYLNKVISINAQSLSHKTLRFMHATLYNNELMFKDKNPTDVSYSRAYLESLILVRGK